MGNNPLAKVEHRFCAVLEVEVIRGENLSKGSLKDFFDTPDPYVALRVPKTPNGWKYTTSCDNTLNPEWGEQFKFYVDLDLPDLNLEIVVYDSNVAKDEVIGKATIPFRPSIEPHRDLDLKIPINKKGFLQLKMLLTPQAKADLRYSLALCREEKQFLRKRCLRVMHAMRKFIGESHPDSPKNYGEVPIVAVLGSGGGFRAMIGMIGCVKALVHAGIWDCTTYVSALSGSSWFISALYSLPEFPTNPEVVKLQQKELRENVAEKDWRRNLNAANFMKYAKKMARKHRTGQPVSFTDFFSHLLADTIMPARKKALLSHQRMRVIDGGAPFPLYTCLHAKRDVSAAEFHEWIEFTPFEVGLPKYGVFMRTEDFGSKFYIGSKINSYPEPPLTYLQGVWGSAFTILFKRLIAEANKKDLIERVRDREAEDVAGQDSSSSRRPSVGSLSDIMKDADAEEELLRREMAEHMKGIDEKEHRRWSSGEAPDSCSDGEEDVHVVRRGRTSSGGSSGGLASDIMKDAGQMAVDQLTAIPGKLQALTHNIRASIVARGSRLVSRMGSQDTDSNDDSGNKNAPAGKRAISALVTVRDESMESSSSSKMDELLIPPLDGISEPDLTSDDSSASDIDVLMSEVNEDFESSTVDSGRGQMSSVVNGLHRHNSIPEEVVEDAADEGDKAAHHPAPNEQQEEVFSSPADAPEAVSSAKSSPAHHPVSSSSGRKFSLPSWAVGWWRSSADEKQAELVVSRASSEGNDEVVNKEEKSHKERRVTVMSAPGDITSDTSNPSSGLGSGHGNRFFSSPSRQRSRPKGIVRQGATRTFKGEHGRDYWKVQRFKEKEKKTKSFWTSVGRRILQSKTFDTRTARAGQIFNPLRGLKLENRFPISPFAQIEEDPSKIETIMAMGDVPKEKGGSVSPKNSTFHTAGENSAQAGDDEADGLFKGIKEAYDTAVKRIYLVDSGLAFNSPYPLVLRPQRGVDVFISFDFSGRKRDNVPPFKELIMAEKWARQNNVPFPQIEEQVKVFVKEPVREFYVFKDENDPNCPTVVHIVLHNGRFKEYDLNGKERASKDEREFCDFPIFSDPENPYSTFNFHYTPLAFDRLVDLMYHNTTYAADTIREELARAVRVKRRQASAPVRNIRDLASFKYSFRDDGTDRLKQLAEKFRSASVKRRTGGGVPSQRAKLAHSGE